MAEVKETVETQQSLWLRGGFPGSFLAKNEADSFIFRKNFIRTYLERDVSQFVSRISTDILDKLWVMLSHNQGTLLNASTLANSLGVSAPTVSSYIDLLKDLLLIRKLKPFHINTKKRLVKSPKVYVRDSGLVHALLGIETYNDLAGHPVVGQSWEGFVMENILMNFSHEIKSSFYRSVAGAEIDLILEVKNKKIAIEIKRSLSPKVERGFYNALEDVQPDKAFIVYPGEEVYPISQAVEVVGLLPLIKYLKKL